MQEKTFSLVPTNLAEAKDLAALISKSDLVPKDYKDKPANVMVAIQMGQELGLQPMQALQGIAVINGRPAVFGDAMLALVRGNGLCQSLSETLEGTGEKMKATCLITRKGEKVAITRTFSVDDAKKGGLWGKSGPWTQYPQRMLQMRARSWACRDAFPDVLKGIAMVEEVRDIVDMGEAEVVPKVKTPQPIAPVKEAEPPETTTPADMPPDDEAEHESLPGLEGPVGGGESPVQHDGVPIVPGAIKIVTMKMKIASKTAVDLQAKFGVSRVEELKQSQVNEVLAWLKV